MLIIDANMFRLAKMLEALLKVSVSDREETLSRYKQIVSEIDAKAFQDILNEIKRIDEHNHSLEDELKFLEGIEKTYDQLLELQSGFKRVCEKYGDLNLELSDLSILNIGYIRERVNAIKGYLTNLRNIDVNKGKIEELTEQLVEQEKKRDLVSKKLLELESSLRENFSNTEGRIIENGKLVPTSVVIEYKKLDLDFVRLLSNVELLDDILLKTVNARNDVLETLKTAEICYNSVLTDESKQFLEDAKKEYLRVEYRLTMIKILKLLSQCFTDYDDVKKKREDLLELIEYRFSCLACLGVVKQKDKDLDPFCRTKVRQQLNIILTIVDNSKDTSRISSQISELVKLTEDMVKQKTDNQIALTNTKSLIENRMRMNDIDITGVSLPVTDVSRKSVLPNQVVSVKSMPDKLNIEIISQKVAGVISRVNEMVNRRSVSKTQTGSYVSPELVIVPKETTKDIAILDSPEASYSQFEEMDFEDDIDIDDEVLEQLSVVELSNSDDNNIDVGLFETVSPFSEPVMFSDKSEDTFEVETSQDASSSIMESNFEFPKIMDFPVLDDNSDESSSSGDNFPPITPITSIETSDIDDSFEDNFWVSQSSLTDEKIGEILSLSFDDNKVSGSVA